MAPLQLLAILALVQAGSSMKVAARRHQFNLHAKDKDSVVSKVIEMLGTEKDKIAEDIKKEAVTMEEYMEYCDDEQKEKDFAIRDSTRAMEDNSAIIEDNSAQIKALEETIAEIGVQMADRQEEHEKIKAIRDRRHEEFKKRETEQQIMVNELAQMEEALKRQIAAMTTPPPAPETPAEEEAAAEGEAPEGEEGGAEALLQTKHVAGHALLPRLSDAQAKHMKELFTRTMNALMMDPEAAPKGTGAFLQQGEDPAGAGTADNLASFEALKKKAMAALQREREQEKKEVGEFMVEKQSLMGAMKLMNTKLDDANENKNELSEEKAQAESKLKDATAAKEADEKYLAELTSTCNAAAAAWEVRQKDAAAEQAAIAKAMEILGSRVKVLLQTNTKTLNKLKAGLATPFDATRQKLVAHFRTLGTKLHSLSMLNLVSAMSVSPMEKIKGLIEDMIAKLQKEAAEAASQHAFCTEENKKNAEAKETTQKELDKIQNRLDSATAKKTELTDRVAELEGEIAEIEKADEEALKIRQEENTAFLKNEADFKEAADAVDDAISVLKEYYGDVGIGAASLAQTGEAQPIAAPPKLGGAKAAGAGGILSILDMMSDEFTKTVSELQRAERDAVAAYEKLTNENENSKTAKKMEIKMSTSQISSLTEAIGDHNTDKTQTTKTMDAILEYIDKLKPTCEGRVVPYAERKAKREAEIEGLKEAFQILVDTAASMA